MRYLTIILLALLASCSWWPWGGGKTGSCLDDDSCDNPNPFEEQLVAGTWYCYGVAGNEPWDCSQTEDPGKQLAISGGRADSAAAAAIVPEDAATPVPEPDTLDLFGFPDGGYAVQLIVRRSVEQVREYAVSHDLDPPTVVSIDREDGVWHLLILDVFDSKAAAEQAAADWVRHQDPYATPRVRRLESSKEATQRDSPAGA